MNQAKQKKLEAKGWKFVTAAEFLGLSPEESAYVELKIALGAFLQTQRKAQDLTQVSFAEKLRSSQSRVAKMEKADPSVSLDLLVRSLYALGVDNNGLASVVAESTPEYGTERPGGVKKLPRKPAKRKKA